MSSKYWCFTENSNAEQFYDDLESLMMEQPAIKYICGQLEKASTGQLHFQGYVQLDRSRQLSFVKNWISETAHFEKQKGSNDQARDYTKKSDTREKPFIEYGAFIKSRGAQGKRNDINKLRDQIIQGRTQRELILDNEMVGTFAKYIKFHDRVRSLFPPKREEPTELKVSLYFGEPGSGKSRLARAADEDYFVVPISNGTLWLDGYDNHKVAILDDFAGKMSKMSLTNTLAFLDIYPVQVPVKGTHVWWMPKRIIITTNVHPRAWYEWKDREIHWAALKRRFHEVIVFEHGEQNSIIPEDFLEDTDLWPEERTQDQYFPA